MRWGRLAALLCMTQILAWFPPQAHSEEAKATSVDASPSQSSLSPVGSPGDQPQAAAEPLPSSHQPDPVLQIVRAQLADSSVTKAYAEDLASLQTFYAARTEGPLWVTEMGLSARG